MSWEKAIQQEVFKPLGITSVGFGAPEGKNALHGHVKGEVAPTGYKGDNPAIYGPAGGLHLSLEDWALFAQDHLKGHAGGGKILTQESYQKLHAPVSKSYALGWGVGKDHSGKVTFLGHDGSNTMWYARVNLDLLNKTGICIVANDATQPQVTEWMGQIVKAGKKD